MFKYLNIKKVVAGAVAGVALAGTQAFAAMSVADEAEVLAGIAGADVLFYKVGGAILIVLAGIWAFKKVRGIM